MPTIKEKIQQKIESAQKWEEANPGMSWASSNTSNDEPKIYFQKVVLESPAFRSLSKWAMLVYLDFLAKREMVSAGQCKGKKFWMILNNGDIQYPYSEAEENGIGRREFRNAIDELQRKGLIDITHRGKGGRKPADGYGDSTKFLIDDRWIEFDENSKCALRPPPETTT